MCGWQICKLYAGQLFLKDKIDSQDQKAKGDKVISPQCFIFKDQQCKNGKNYECDNLLYDLELKEAEWAAIAIKAYPIGRYLKSIFKQCDAPANEDNAHEAQTIEAFHILKPQVPIPCQGHK